MTSRSDKDKAIIYYMTARVAFKKRKKVHERVMWIVSVFDDPNDIRKYDHHTMRRLEDEIYGNAKSEKMIMIREIIDKKKISFSNLSIDEHKRQYQEEV
jgi:hypothetical protein